MRKTSTYARKRRATSTWERERHKHVNPIKEALIVAGIREDVERLRTGASLLICCRRAPSPLHRL